MKLLHSLIPDRELNLDAMRQLLQQHANASSDGISEEAPSPVASNLNHRPEVPQKEPSERCPAADIQNSEIEDIRYLHEEIGCLMVDAMGKQRMLP